jgi:hypothetical protein
MFSANTLRQGCRKQRLSKNPILKIVLLSFLSCFVFGASLYAQSFTGSRLSPFAQAYNQSIRGDVRIFGNTMLQVQGGGCPVVPNPSISDGESPGNNAKIVTRYAKIDPSTTSSSSSQLIMPHDANVTKAYLVWQGIVNANQKTAVKSIKLRTPTSGGYVSLIAGDADLNWDRDTSGGGKFTYQAAVDVTHLVTTSGIYTVADLITHTGAKYPVLGTFGAWAIVVAYKSTSEPLRNVAIFKGYDIISSAIGSKTFHVGPFFTPVLGDVDSNFLVFAGEGDNDIHGDYAMINGIRLRNNNGTTNNAFNAGITSAGARNPSCVNNIGIDIHTFNVGTTAPVADQRIIKNKMTAADIRLGSTQDTYYPSIFAFSTQLYEPNVCYYIDTITREDNNATVFKNGAFLNPLEKNKDYKFDIWISNMNTNSANLEVAREVEVSMQFAQTANLSYINDSTLIQNIGAIVRSTLTDAVDSDLGEYKSVVTTSTWRVGEGASGSLGGTLYPTTNFNNQSAKVFVGFKGRINNISGTDVDLDDLLNFKASFKTLSVEIARGAPQTILPCKALNTTILFPSPSGNFTVVNQGFNGTQLETEAHTPDNALYTQIVNKPFNATLVSLGDYVSGSTSKREVVGFNPDDNTTYDVYAIEALDCSVGGSNATCSEAERADRCKSATVIGTASVATGNFSAPNDGKIQLSGIVVTKASREASLKIVLNSDNDRSSCSIDNFAIRPKDFVLGGSDFNGKLIGGHPYDNGTITARDVINIVTIDYNQTTGAIGHNSTLDLPSNCTDLNETVTGELSVVNGNFINGVANLTLKYDNIGNLTVRFEDLVWANVDKDDSDCKPDYENNHDSNGRLGCYIAVNKTVTFVPDRFSNTLDIYDFKPDFTYISNNYSMSALMELGFTAVLEDGSPATNYHKDCYAKDINYTIALINDTPIGWERPVNSVASAKEQIRLYRNATKWDNALVDVNFSAPSGDFEDGTANLGIRFGFSKYIEKAQNPFVLWNTDFNITLVVDEDGISGEDFDSADSSVTSYYGRVRCSQDRYIATNPHNITTPINYEVYCAAPCSNAIDYGIDTSKPSPVEHNWYVNIQHNALDFGNVTTYNLTTPTKIHPEHPSTTVITDGNESNTFIKDTTQVSFTDIMTMMTQDWLYYRAGDRDRSCILHFPGGGGRWAGEGKVNTNQPVGRVVETNASNANTVINPKIDW